MLFLGSNDPGQRYVVMQAWTAGQPAQSFGWIETPGRDPEPVLQPPLVEGEQVVAILLTQVPGQTSDELVVVPAPGTGQVLYGGYDDLTPASMPSELDGVALVDRPYDAQEDVLRLLDGDGRPLPMPGDVGGPSGQVRVFDLLCGVKGCG